MASVEEKNLIIDDNLKKTDSELYRALEKRAAHISEKAKLVINSGNDETHAVYEKFFGETVLNKTILKENEKYISSVKKSIAMYDKLNCVNSLYPSSEREEKSANTGFESDTVVYLKNPLADIAYSNFSKLLKDARALYEESFSSVCEEVYYGRVPYCILPLENSDDGRLSGFGNMIRKYELKIVLTCSVESANGKITKFALLKREIDDIDCPAKISDGKYVEIGFNFGENERLYEVLAAARFFGYKLNKVDSMPIYYSEKEYYFDAVFSGNGDIKRFMFWLELEVPRYEIIGIYTHIKATAGKNGG